MENNDTIILNKLEKIIKNKAKLYQMCPDKEKINKEHYRNLLNELLNILINRNN